MGKQRGLFDPLQRKYPRKLWKSPILPNLLQISLILVFVVTLQYFDVALHRSKSVLNFLQFFITFYYIATLLVWYFQSNMLDIPSKDYVPSSRKGNVSYNKIVLHLQIFGVTLFGAFIYHITAILLGAYLSSLVEETFLFSSLMSTLSVLPVYLASNCSLTQMRDTVFCQSYDKDNTFTKLAKLQAYCCMAGAWIGAVLLPLDWDRDYQKWPIPCACGGIIGACVGQILGCIQVYITIPGTKLP